MRPIDLEALLIGLIGQQLDRFASTDVPAGRTEFYRLYRIGGPRYNLVQSAVRVMFEAWSDKDAWDWAADLYELVDGLNYDPQGLPIAEVTELTDPVYNPDAKTNIARYHFIATFTTDMEN